MPLDLNDLLHNERWVDVHVGEHMFRVAYRPGMTSLQRQAQLQKRMRLLQNAADTDEEEQAKEVGIVFCEMVSNWDLTEYGRPLPITPEIVTTKLPGAAFNAIMDAIGNDNESDAEEKKVQSVTSGAGLPKGVKREVAQNGTPQSEPRGTWA